MAQNVLITNSNYVRKVTNISDNVNDKHLFPAINTAQEIYLKGVIGETLLKTLKDMVLDETINADRNAVYKDLLVKCQMYIAYTAVADLVVTTSYKLDNNGIYRTSDENITFASLEEVHNIQEFYENKASFFKLELINFILNNRSKLKEIDDCICNSIRANLFSAESCGIVLGGSRGRKSSRINNGYKGK